MDWEKAVKMPEGPERHQELSRLLKQLPYFDEETRRDEIKRLIEAEYSIPDDAGLRDITIARLQAILSLDDEGARSVAETYDDVMNKMPGDIAFRRAAIVQTVARHEFSVDEEARLRALIPNVLGEKPKELSVATPEPQDPVEGHSKRRWWMFWQRQREVDPEKAQRLQIGDIDERGYSDNVVEELRRIRQF